MIAHTITTTTKIVQQQMQNLEPTVIDEQVIIDAVKEKYKENLIKTPFDRIKLDELTELSLSFKNIKQIQNFDGLNKLQKLQLDNNKITKIENLDHLVNLKWLDLSFNLITKIEGLHNLVNLTDLSLFQNQITVVENIDNLQNLNVFSIGNNKLESIESIKDVFGKNRFKKLQVLNVQGNIFTEKDQDEYKKQLIRCLYNLKYLDYVYIDQNQRDSMKDDDNLIGEMESNKNLIDQMLQEQQEILRLKQKQEIDDAKMNLVDNFSQELVQDSDLDKLRQLKPVEEQISKFQEKVKEIIDALQKNVIIKNKKKQELVKQFLEAIKVREKDSEVETIEILRKLEHKNKNTFREWDHYKREKEQDNDDINELREQIKQKLIGLNDMVKSTQKQLMDVEIRIQEDIKVAINDFEINKLNLIKKDMDELIKPQFVKISEEIKNFHSKVSEETKKEFDKQQQIGSDDEAEYADDLVSEIFQNRESYNQVLSQLKESLTGKNDKKETELIGQIGKDVDNFIAQCKEEQYRRNRRNIKNIYEIITQYEQKILQCLKEDEEDQDDDN